MIPKIIHRIWVGGSPPAHLVEMGKGWQKLHPDWEIKIWRDADLKWLENQQLFDNAERYVPADAIGQFKADIARYEILYKFGGVYVDFDVEPLKPFDDLMDVEAFAGWEEQNVFVGNTVLGSVPGHRFFKKLIGELPRQAGKYKGRAATWVSGPRFVTRQYSEQGGLTVYPQSYFFPYSYKELVGSFDPAVRNYPDAYSVHHWEHQRRKRSVRSDKSKKRLDPVRFSVAIMAHPKRSEWVAELSDTIGASVKVVWDRRNDRWDTGRRSLMAHDPEADYHVVIQDDALIPPRFLDGLQRVLDNRPENGPIGFYMGKTRPRPMQVQAIADAARRLKARWIRMPGPWWGVGIAVPVADIVDIVAYGDKRTDVANYDLKIAKFYQNQGRMCHYTFPSIVEHRHGNNPSLVEGRVAQNRKAQEYVGETSPADIDWVGPIIDAEGRPL